MEISRDADGLRFMGECAPEKGFVAGDIQCAGCGRRIDPHIDSRDIALVCAGCGFKKTFWAEADMQVYLAENWNRLRQACTHPSVTLHQSTLR
jgi:hypothetical protein